MAGNGTVVCMSELITTRQRVLVLARQLVVVARSAPGDPGLADLADGFDLGVDAAADLVRAENFASRASSAARGGRASR